MVSDETSPPDHKALADLLAPLDLLIPKSRAAQILEDFIKSAQKIVRLEKAGRLAHDKESKELITRIATAGKKYTDLLKLLLPESSERINSEPISQVLLPVMRNPTVHLRAHAELADEITHNAASWMKSNTSKGRPPAIRREVIVLSAGNCWRLLTETKATTTPTGPFGVFAYGFETLVTGEEPQDIDRVLKQCVPMLNREHRIQKAIDDLDNT